MNRSARASLAHDTLAILDAGGYTNAAGACVDLRADVEAAIHKSELFTPSQLERLAPPSGPAPHTTRFDVRNETTLAAARRLTAEQGDDEVLCLNFASAKNPGGGFLGGSEAQEESLARASALYPTLTAHPAYYDTNRANRSPLYTDHLIGSPSVPVFRDDDGRLLDTPYRVGFITMPAPNRGAALKNQPGLVDEVVPTLRRRIGHVLAVADAAGYAHLVLGAWGCGVFRNDPTEVAALFAEALRADAETPGAWAGRFESVTFAVLDKPDGPRIAAFRDAFGG